jgi:protein-disulfide isomerase
MNSSSNNNTGLIVGIIVITVALFGGLVFLLTRLPSDVVVAGDENVTFSDAADPAVGPEKPAVTVHMYEDFQCPACAASYPIVKQVMEAYKDRVRFVWKDFPLENIHPVSRPSADAARCAQVQGKFWEYQDQLFQQRDWISSSNKTDAFLNLAKNVPGLNQAQFKTCVDSKAGDSLVATTIREGFANKVDATPTFFVNQKRQFAMGFADWQRVLDAALAANPGTAAPAATVPATTTAPVASTTR